VRKKVAYAMDVAAMGMPGSRGRRVECYGLGNWVCITGQASFRLDTGEMVGIGDPRSSRREMHPIRHRPWQLGRYSRSRYRRSRPKSLASS